MFILRRFTGCATDMTLFICQYEAFLQDRKMHGPIDWHMALISVHTSGKSVPARLGLLNMHLPRTCRWLCLRLHVFQSYSILYSPSTPIEYVHVLLLP